MSVRTLIVDDSAQMRKAIIGVCRSVPGCEVVGEGADGLEGVQLARAHRPHLIVLDINMPNMGGLEALRVLKGELPGTTFVMVTSMLEPKVRDKALELGAYACLQKGDEIWKRLQAIATQIRQSSGIAPNKA